MGFLDRAKAAFGIGAAPKGSGKSGRPALKDIPAATSSASLDDALEAREAGRMDEARAILIAIDRGKGLRTVLRAAAAVEAGDEDELAKLLPGIATREPSWRLALQAACALSLSSQDPQEASRLVGFAKAHGAPEASLAWAAASRIEDESKRRGRVDLLFADAALARTVAAREWNVEGAEDDREAIERYATFAHGRDAIRRFGASTVARVVERAFFGVAAEAQDVGPPGGERTR
jgi:hypothetical protein